MELISRMMDGSIAYGDDRGLEPSTSGPGLNQDDKMDRLEKVPIFQACTRRQLRAVARIAAVFDAGPGAILTRTGEPGNDFFLIVDGTARVEVSARKQRRLRPGDYFGEMSLLDGEPRSATVVAETPMRLIVIARRNFSKLLNEAPGLTEGLLSTLSRRIRQAEKALNS
jgi:CRP-like cAMP-binding protein